MKIEFFVSYQWDSNRQEYEAEVTVYLPTEPNQEGNPRLHSLLRNREVRVLGDTLTYCWGHKDCDCCRSCRLYDKDLPSLSNQALELAKESTAALRAVFTKNKEKSSLVQSPSLYKGGTVELL